MAQHIARVYRRVYEAVNHRLRTAAGGRLAHRCGPIWISLLFTERCNARCTHCDIWTNRGREHGPSADDWKRVLKEIRDWLGPVHVCVTGGEALLMPMTTDVVAHGARLGLLMEVLTHGYWGDQSRIAALARARPWKITVSLDGLGDVHSQIRGRENFFERTSQSLETLNQLRREEGLGYSILLKTVVMRQNLGELEKLARFASEHDMEIFYQPIEQNYNTPDDARWFEHSRNWPTDTERAVAAVERLIALKREGLPIANNVSQLEVMIPYFRDPAPSQVAVRAHTAHDRRQTCAALGLVQIQSNGDVHVCSTAPAVGNVLQSSLPAIWRARPQWWMSGCCREQPVGLTTIESRRAGAA